MDNATLRRLVKRQRKKLDPKQRANFALMTSLHLPKLLPHLPKHAKIGLYLDDFGELPTAPILAFCQKHDFTPFLPITKKNQALTFAPCFYDLKKTPLKRHPLGMKEPFLKNAVLANRLDCIICPLVAVDRHGNRLGMGGGFYDRTFAHFTGLKVGWCYHFQIVENLAVNTWDKKVDMVVSDKGLLRF
ncbi:5-formyltetrahydrofolate cyclo-ligase [Moraxella oblonga]|uniref:5-formyltetrahydrofolate cyclo-ligase n=1 Tax=Moraxella oblonga TaxID=200413 RepID=UPI00082B664B|nr:5-formyltetrahydrofolate cyclo-ligase [Moraxella oblonga]